MCVIAARPMFEPCGMKHTCFDSYRPPRGVLVTTGRSEHGDRSAFDHPYGAEYGFQYRVMGGIVSNLIDLRRWDRGDSSPRSSIPQPRRMPVHSRRQRNSDFEAARMSAKRQLLTAE